jgi:hypothetical protein
MRAIAIEGFGRRDRLKLVYLSTPETGLLRHHHHPHFFIGVWGWYNRYLGSTKGVRGPPRSPGDSLADSLSTMVLRRSSEHAFIRA